MNRPREHIPNLSNPIITNTNLSNANLTKVQFIEATLDYLNISNSIMGGKEFGQKPFIEFLPSENIQSSSFSSDGKWAISKTYDGVRTLRTPMRPFILPPCTSLLIFCLLFCAFLFYSVLYYIDKMLGCY